MKYKLPLALRQRYARNKRERYARNAAYRLECINKRRSKDGSPLLNSIEEAVLRLPLVAE